ncbi:MAG: ribosomal protein S18-alanine N-acetyltransferase [Candidatus Eremiobacteraeota bacterium]|nr:ribosomal protein S18-alanine N-acetyltransferase [Candidatus Eremiobacteraeota bacterium]
MRDEEAPVSIGFMRAEDIPRIREIEKQCFTDLWPEDGFERELQNTKVGLYLVAHTGEMVVGYMGAWIIMDESHITTLAVDPSCQHRKIGLRLVLRLMREAITRGARWSTLEVAEKNTAALRLYDKFGFNRVGIRRDYYGEGNNALVMWAGNLQKDSYRARLEALEQSLDEARERGEERLSGSA